MAKGTAMSLPNEVMIEILSRVDSSNHLELRCVCKLWNSLVLDPLFLKNHLRTSFTNLISLCIKAKEHFDAFKSRIKKEHEKEDDGNEKDLDLDLDFNGAGAEEEEEEENEEEEEDGDVDAEEEEEEEKQWKMNLLAEIDKFMEKENELEKKGENLDNLDVQWMIINVAKFDNTLTYVRYLKSFTLNFLESIKSVEDSIELKGNLESIRVEMQTMEDKMNCLKSFVWTYLEEVKKIRDEKKKERAELMEKES